MATENSTQKTDIDRNAWPYFATAGNPALAALDDILSELICKTSN